MLKDAEVVHAAGERGPVVIGVSKVDGHRGNRGVPADRVSGCDLRTEEEAAAWGWESPMAGSPGPPSTAYLYEHHGLPLVVHQRRLPHQHLHIHQARCPLRGDAKGFGIRAPQGQQEGAVAAL